MNRSQLALILLSFFIAVAVSMGLRIAFSPQRLQEIVNSNLKKESLAVEFTAEKIELSLARGPIPQIALRFQGLEIIQNDRCFRNTIWRIDEVYFPLRLLTLLKGQTLLGDVLAQHIDVNLGPAVGTQSCEEQPMVKEVNVSKERKPQSSHPVKNLFDVISGIYVAGLKIRHQSFPEYRVEVTDFSLNPVGNKIEFNGNISAATVLLAKDPLPGVKVAGSVDNGKLLAQISGRWFEGIIKFNVEYAGKEPMPLKVSGQLKHLPLANFLKIYEQINGHEVGSYPRSMWLTCDIEFQSHSNNFTETPIEFRGCLIEGDAGTWESSRLLYDPKQGVFKDEFEVKASRLPLKTAMSIMQIDVLDGVLDDYGLLSGTIKVRPPDVMVFDGFVDDLEVYFANQGMRSRQGIKRIKIELQKRDGRISGLFSDFEMRKGELEGSASFNFDKRFQNGVVQIQSKKIILDPSIQELLVKEKLGKIEAYGKFKVSDRKLELFKGDVGLEKIENQDLKLNSLRTSLAYSGQTLKMNSKIKSLQINTGSNLFNIIRPLLLDKKFETNWVEATDISVQMSGMKQYLEWKRGVAIFPADSISVASEGIWQEGAGLSGWLSVDFPKLKLLKWEISGDVLSPRILPSSQWLKELVIDKPVKKQLKKQKKK